MTFQGGSKAPPTSSSWIESGKGQNVDDEIHKYSYGRAVTGCYLFDTGIVGWTPNFYMGHQL
jgi:hypothetical protein